MSQKLRIRNCFVSLEGFGAIRLINPFHYSVSDARINDEARVRRASASLKMKSTPLSKIWECCAISVSGSSYLCSFAFEKRKIKLRAEDEEIRGHAPRQDHWAG